MRKKREIISIIAAISVVILYQFIHVLFIGEFSIKDSMIDLFLTIVLFWFIAKHYDKMKFYMARMEESEKNYKILIETIPDAILIYSQNIIIYTNEAGTNMLGGQKKEDILGKSIYHFVNPHIKN